MRVKIKTEGALSSLTLSPAAASALMHSGEADLVVLRQGLVLIASPGVLADLTAQKMEGAASTLSSPQAASASTLARVPISPAWLAQLSGEEMALLRKLSGVKFEERIVPDIDRLLSATEKKVLLLLTNRKLVSIFKNPKYPKGVYNLSPLAYSAGAHPQEVKLAQQSAALKPASPSPPPSPSAPSVKPLSSFPSSYSSSAASASARQLSINTVEHLGVLGYMVLDNENDAKRVMPEIKERLKNDDVKGVRGFDKRYYVLRRSFLMEYEGPLLALLDLGPASPEELSGKLNLTSEAVRVLLMILGDEGEVIEKRRGNWVRA